MAEALEITKASTFARWWQYRDLRNDGRLKRAAINAGLVTTRAGLLWLTDAGKALRKEGVLHRQLQSTIRAGKLCMATTRTPTPSRAERGEGR